MLFKHLHSCSVGKCVEREAKLVDAVRQGIRAINDQHSVAAKFFQAFGKILDRGGRDIWQTSHVDCIDNISPILRQYQRFKIFTSHMRRYFVDFCVVIVLKQVQASSPFPSMERPA